MFSDQFYEERLSFREWNMKFLLETVMCIMHCRKYHLHYCNRDSPICIITIKIVIHIFVAETVTCICAAEHSNCIIATETVTCIIVTERSTNIPVTESITSKPAKMQQTFSLAIIAVESVSCIVPTETVTCRIDYRNYHLQK